MKFKVGDKVIVNNKTSFSRAKGKIGYIVCDNEDEFLSKHYGIRIEGFEGHSLGGRINTSDGYWVEEYALEYYKKSNKENY